MKRTIRFASLLCLVVVLPLFAQQASFDAYFKNETLRIDYYHTGTKGTESFSLDKLYEEGEWSGSKTNLMDPLRYGEYMATITDTATGVLVWSRGFSSMFQEWQTTDEAIAGIVRTFHETVRIPYPKAPIRFELQRRDKKNVFNTLFTAVIDPNSPVQVNKEKRAPSFPVVKFLNNGSAPSKVDIVILGDGYTKDEMKKFREDVKHFTDVLFGTEPFKSRKSDFNVWTIEVASEDSGIDKPDRDVWKTTPLGTMYNTFGSARYVLTEENKILRDICGHVPYDAIFILFNDNRYGGGGIYNLYATCYTQTDVKGREWQMDYVFVHEFGHSFAGLADEYYSSDVAFNEMYPEGMEPWEPNITRLYEPTNLKWKPFVKEGTPIPTPWGKAEYDSLESIRRKMDRLAPDYYQKAGALMEKAQSILKNKELESVVGAFEGAGYTSSGMYRPSLDCRMFSLSLVPFDPVCRASIEKMIDYYTR